MLTALEARLKMNEVITDRESRIASWVKAQLPHIEEVILDAILGTRETAYYTVDISKEISASKDSPSLYAESLAKCLRDHKYTVDFRTCSGGYSYTICYSEKTEKVYR